jgi:protein XRP2
MGAKCGCQAKSGKNQKEKLLNGKKEKKPVDKSKLNPKDFIASGRKGEIIVKTEGTIDGQQFNIEECNDCDIFLFDVIATAFIDHCKNCRIFVGPVESSIFVRNCTDCNFVIACQQFRSRDCKDCRFSLLSTTEPIIETSTGMRFACFDYFYFSLQNQLASAGLDVINNKWWQIHDFNKNADNPNWDLLPQEDVQNLLRTTQCTAITAEELAMDKVVPVTLGSRPPPVNEYCFVVFLPQSQAVVEAFITHASKEQGWTLSRTRSTVLPEDRAKSLFSWTPKEKLEKKCKGKELIGIEVCGAGICEKVSRALPTLGNAKDVKGVKVVPENSRQMLAKAFFEVWKDEI